MRTASELRVHPAGRLPLIALALRSSVLSAAQPPAQGAEVRALVERFRNVSLGKAPVPQSDGTEPAGAKRAEAALCV